MAGLGPGIPTPAWIERLTCPHCGGMAPCGCAEGVWPPPPARQNWAASEDVRPAAKLGAARGLLCGLVLLPLVAGLAAFSPFGLYFAQMNQWHAFLALMFACPLGVGGFVWGKLRRADPAFARGLGYVSSALTLIAAVSIAAVSLARTP